MAKDKIYIICPNCNGEGVVIRYNTNELTGESTTSYEATCPTCNGEKKIHWGWFDVKN